MTATRPVCGFRWPLLDPNPEDARAARQHVCRLPKGHDGLHRCGNDGEEHPGGL